MSDDLPDRLEAPVPDGTPISVCHLLDEAAAEIRTLRAQLETARADEQAAVVAWLAGLHWTHSYHREAQKMADAIASGQHRETRDEG